MEKKYELIKSKYFGLFHVLALRDFCNVQEGDVGGLVASERNLSHHGTCWVRDGARVYGNARVYDNAVVADMARVYGDARIQGSARIQGNAWVYDQAIITGDAIVSGEARVYGSAVVLDRARVSGSAHVHDHAIVSRNDLVQFSHCTRDISLRENLAMAIRCQTGLEVIRGHVYAYKYVREDLSSLHDPTCIYSVGEYKEVDVCDSDPTVIYGSGMYASHPSYWEGKSGEKLIQVKIALDDIITIQAGAIRCKRLFVVDVCDTEVY